MSDFEAGLRKALREVYPKAVVSGCWFHFKKCIRKRIKLLGISKLWVKKARESDPVTASNAKRIYKMIANLPLLPKQYFVPGWTYIKNTAIKLRLTTHFKKMFSYFERTWLAEVRPIYQLLL